MQKSSEKCKHKDSLSRESATAIVSERLSVGKEEHVGQRGLENFPVLHLTGTVRPFDSRKICARWNLARNSGESADIHYHTRTFLWKATWRCHTVSKCLKNLVSITTENILHKWLSVTKWTWIFYVALWSGLLLLALSAINRNITNSFL